MTTTEIDNLSAHELDIAIATVMEPVKPESPWNHHSPWWLFGFGRNWNVMDSRREWIPAQTLNGKVAVALLDALQQWDLDVTIDLRKPGAGGGRFRAECSNPVGTQYAVAFAPTLPLAVARLFLQIAAVRKEVTR